MTPDQDRRDSRATAERWTRQTGESRWSRGALLRSRLRLVLVIAFTFIVLAAAAATPTDPYL